ncbi:zinc ABC transporter substrate-binding protein [Alkalihalobacillus oceani]|uniref:metal ABC transporter solute-binding protein, Zn/Mn family n=1 Tax=Halalkalibacter oceani TaxID=1653776 RepID=UPI002041CC9C|nr:zinc ABC transporter substrate-binding protein [Halalkalibacter oceani]MCM3760805.1 zinc ABC transporter substrate-binding protein [Halalkalibacter oceani]
MKKFLMVAATALLLLNACSNTETETVDETEENQETAEKLTIMTSIFPLEDWTKKIGGDFVEVTNIVPVGADAHTYEPTPNEMVAVAEADAFIYNGAGIEAFADRIVEAVANEGIAVLEASSGVELIEDHHHHDHSHGHDHDHGEIENGTLRIEGVKDHYHTGDQVHLTAHEIDESGHDHWHWYTLAPGEDPENDEAWEVVPDNGTNTYEGVAEAGQLIQVKLFGEDHEVVAQSEPLAIEIDDHHGDHDHDHGHGHDDHGHVHGDYDPHVWLDPVLSIEMAEHIKQLLVELMPEQEAYFEANFEDLRGQFEELDQQFQEVADHAQIDTFIVSHAGYGYWEARYGIKQIGIAGLSPTNEPTQQQLIETIEQAEELGLEYVLFEPNISPAVAQTVQDYLEAEALYLHPLEALTAENVESGADYFSLMEENIETLRTVLKAD